MSLDKTDKQFINSAIHEQTLKLEETLTNRIEDYKSASRYYQRNTNWVFFTLVLLLFGIFALVFTPAGDWVNLKTGWVIPTAPTAADAAAPQEYRVDANAVTAATRNMITLLSPMVIGLILWILGNVGLNRFKVIDENLEKNRSDLDAKVENTRQELAATSNRNADHVEDRVMRNIEKTLTEAVTEKTNEINTSFNKAVSERQAAITAIENSVKDLKQKLDQRFGPIADTYNASYETDIGLLTSVAYVHRQVSQLFNQKPNTLDTDIDSKNTGEQGGQYERNRS